MARSGLNDFGVRFPNSGQRINADPADASIDKYASVGGNSGLKPTSEHLEATHNVLVHVSDKNTLIDDVNGLPEGTSAAFHGLAVFPIFALQIMPARLRLGTARCKPMVCVPLSHFKKEKSLLFLTYSSFPPPKPPGWFDHAARSAKQKRPITTPCPESQMRRSRRRALNQK